MNKTCSMRKMRVMVANDMQKMHNYCKEEYAIMTELKHLRQSKKMTQKEAAKRIGVSLRSYISYENDEEKSGSLKYRFLLEEMRRMDRVDEEHGVLSIDEIREAARPVLEEYNAEFCILFGSYAKGTASDQSDVDLLVGADVRGLRFFGLAERLREAFHKKVDLLDLKQLSDNEELLKEVLKTGVRIYGSKEG